MKKAKQKKQNKFKWQTCMTAETKKGYKMKNRNFKK